MISRRIFISSGLALAAWLSRPRTGRAVEPITAAVIAIAICKGVMEGLGTRIFNSAFPQSGRSFEELMADFIKTINAMLRQAIQQEFIRHYQAQVAALQQLFLEYTNNTQNKDLLENLRQKSVELTAQLESLEIKTIDPFVVMGSLSLAVHQEIFNSTNNDGDRKNIAVVAMQLLARKKPLQDKLQEFNISRFSGIIAFPPSRHSGWFFIYTDLNGIEHRSGNQNTLRAEREKQIADEYQIAENSILKPIYPVFDDWSQIAKKYA